MNFIFFKFNQSKSSRIEGVEQDNFRKIRSYRFIYQIVLIQFEKQKNTHKLDGIWNCVKLPKWSGYFKIYQGSSNLNIARIFLYDKLYFMDELQIN